jgi:hypothetical protein
VSNSKRNYNPQELQQLLTDWDALETRGVLLEPYEHRCGIDDQRRSINLLICQWGEWASNQIFELSSGAFAYILHAFIRSHGGRRAIIMDWDLELPWSDHVEWLEDPRDRKKSSAVYAFRGKDWWGFPRKEVLNHQLRGKIAHGDIREGLLLGISYRPPGAYRHGEMIPAILKVFDQYDCPHSGTFELYLSRPPRPKETIRQNRVRRSLFSDRDPVPSM